MSRPRPGMESTEPGRHRMAFVHGTEARRARGAPTPTKLLSHVSKGQSQPPCSTSAAIHEWIGVPCLYSLPFFVSFTPPACGMCGMRLLYLLIMSLFYFQYIHVSIPLSSLPLPWFSFVPIDRSIDQCFKASRRAMSGKIGFPEIYS
jgi:hypothetical protein